jgi:hypothetical protein
MLLPDPVPSPEPTTEPAKCECPLVNCLQGPGLCDCINTAAQNCYQRCGGTPPKLQSCPDLPQPTPEATCECESVFCAQSFPESCYCANAAAQACYKKCGVVPNLQVRLLHMLIQSSYANMDQAMSSKRNPFHDNNTADIHVARRTSTYTPASQYTQALWRRPRKRFPVRRGFHMHY